jgi:ABC-2 type transport system permease protein
MSAALEPKPLGPLAQQGLFQWLRLRLGVNAWNTLFGQSLIRPTTIGAACAVIAIFMFIVSYAGFSFLARDIDMGIRGRIVGRLVDMLFFTLGFLLIFSSGLILYGSLFHAPEAMFLLSKPLDDDQIFGFKFQGAIAFSSWAFLLLGGPVLIAFGLVVDAPWAYYPLLLLFFLGFVLVPGALGAILLLVLVNVVPRRRKTVFTLVVIALVVGVIYWVYGLLTSHWPSLAGAEMVNILLGHFAFAASNLIPNHWVGEGLREATRSNWPAALYYLALVWSNGLFLYLIAAWTARRLYRRGFNLMTTGGDLRRRHGGHWLDHGMNAVLMLIPFVGPRTRLLIIKDFRTFRRDPQQWGQVLIFVTLMALYVGFVPRVAGQHMTWHYLIGVGLLNLLVVGLLISIFTSRFIYPMLSLEGRKFWILGLMPLERAELVWGKFIFASVGVLFASVPLIILSDLMLGTPWPGCLLHLATVVLLSFGLSGLSVGIGALVPNFRETDPSVIAVGFGGTINLIAGLIYLLAIVTLVDLPYHATLLAADSSATVQPRWLLIVPLGVLGVGVGILASLLPLRLGLSALKKMEF